MSIITTKQKQVNAKFVEVCFDGLHFEVDRYIAEGAQIESAERNGYSCLSEACIAGHTIVVGQLLRALANPNSTANDGRTPLHRAAFHGWQPVINLLLDAGADPKKRDGQGMSPADLARSPLVRQQIKDFPEAKTIEAQEERRRKVKEQAAATLEEDQAAATPDDAADSEDGDDTAFNPPTRYGKVAAEALEKAESRARAKAEAKAKVVAKKTLAIDTAKADKERRDKRFKDATAELNEMITNGDDMGDSGYSIANAPRPLTARVEVVGASEDRLNGIYQVRHASSDRIEFTKADDELCMIFWSSWQDEWRMLIADYKMGNTMYRHNYRPNWKADECHGVPGSDWQKWFGSDSPPTVRLLPVLRDGEAAETNAATATATVAEVASKPVAEVGAKVSIERVEAGAKLMKAREKADELQAKKTNKEYLELNSTLNIVSVDDGTERRAAGASNLSSNGQGKQIQLTEGGERIVETADGLFGAGEVAVQDELPITQGPTQDDLARTWLESTGTKPQLPANWESILAAKGTSQELFAEQKSAEACQATTAAIQALQRFEALGQPRVGDDLDDHELEQLGQRPSEEEIESMRGVLHSNRSLLLQNQILAGDSAVLAFGSDAAWRLVVSDADLALRANATNFKASFRRGRALLELGELEEALQDATNVVEHYSNSSSTPNPEAAALRERILEEVKKERAKWGEKGPRRWNSGAKDLITEVATSTTISGTTTSRGAANGAVVPKRPMTAPSVPETKPKNSVEMLRNFHSMKKDPAMIARYIRERMTPGLLQSIFARFPIEPDDLATVLVALRCHADDVSFEPDLVAEYLRCLLKTNRADIQFGMLSDSEIEVVRELLGTLPAGSEDTKSLQVSFQEILR